MYVEITAVGPYETARITLQPDGTILLYSSIMPVGQGSETTQRQLVAEELGIAIEQVAIRQGDTDEVPDAVGTFASRGAAVGGAVGRMAARELVEKIVEYCAASVRMRSGGAAMGMRRREISGARRGVRSDGGNSRAFGVAAASGEASRRKSRPSYRLEVPRPSYSYAAHIAVVEIDPETGRIEIPRYTVAHDCGKIVNPYAGRRDKSSAEWFRELAKCCANGWSTMRTGDLQDPGDDGLRFARGRPMFRRISGSGTWRRPRVSIRSGCAESARAERSERTGHRQCRR